MNTIKIGSQEWATQDLKVSKFRNGEDVPLVTDDVEWSRLETAAYCVTPNGDYLYNWYAVNDPRGLAPRGFHVPTDEEWTELIEFLGGADAAEELKSADWDGRDASGFSALPGGNRDSSSGGFGSLGAGGFWWSSSPSRSGAWGRTLASGDSSVYRNYNSVRDGFAVRCLKTLEHQREMNNNKQSSVEWLFEELFNSFEKFSNGDISFAGYMAHNLTLRVQAQAVHREEITNAWDSGHDELGRATASPIKYYHETFNTNEK